MTDIKEGRNVVAVGNSPELQFGTVVFATDFSWASQNAGSYASAFSTHFASRLVVAHGFLLTQAALEVEVEKPLSSQLRIDLYRELTAAARALQAGYGKPEGILLDGDPRKSIAALAHRRSPALVVMGTHGGGAIDRFILGSTAEGVLRHCTQPALTVGPKVRPLAADQLHIRRILYASDCTVEAARGAVIAVEFAKSFSAELDLLNVTQSSEGTSPESLPRLQEGFHKAVESLSPETVRQVSEQKIFVSVGQPITTILKHIDERQIDLLILGLKRSRHLGLHSDTSDAFSIIAKAKCPVLTVAADSSSHPS